MSSQPARHGQSPHPARQGASSHPAPGRASSHLGVWFCAFAGPAAWTAHQLLSLGLVPVACFGTGPWLLHAITLLMTLVALAGLLVGLNELGRGGTAGRQFVAGASVVSDAFFTLVILAEALPDFVLSPCWS